MQGTTAESLFFAMVFVDNYDTNTRAKSFETSSSCTSSFLKSLELLYFIGNITSQLLDLSIAGKANLERADLEPALKGLKDRLMTKNVVC